MTSRVYFFLTILSLIGTALSAFFIPRWGFIPLLGFLLLGIISLALLHFSIVRPAKAAQRGMDILAAQDFNTRLRPVGERNANRVVRLFNTMIDRLREERLKNLEQESLLALLIEASPMGVAILDFDGRLSLLNDAFLRFSGSKDDSRFKGRRPEEWLGMLAVHLCRLSQGESAVVNTGDTMRYRCYRLSFIRRGFPVEFFLVESLTEEVREAERSAYEKVIRILSHEVNNTLCGVRSVLGLLADSSSEDDLREAARSCDDRCERLSGFVTSYADVVRLPKPVLKRMDLGEEMSKTIPFLRMILPERVELIAEIPDTPVIIEADMSQLQQAVVNIVKNAGDSIREEGYVRLTVSAEPVATLEIINNGEGISEEVAANMFRPFYTNKPHGRGIGLTLTSEILTRHHARFRLYTSDDGLTRFRIEFTDK